MRSKLWDNRTIYHAQKTAILNLFFVDRFGYTALLHTDFSRDQGTSG